MGPKFSKVFNPHLPFNYIWRDWCWRDIVVHLNIFSSSSEPWETIIFWMIWSILLTQHSMLHDLFTIKVNGKTSRGWIHLMPTVCRTAVSSCVKVPCCFTCLLSTFMCESVVKVPHPSVRLSIVRCKMTYQTFLAF